MTDSRDEHHKTNRAALPHLQQTADEGPRIEYHHLLPGFMRAMNEIGEYGARKYGDRSFQARAASGDRERDKRTTTQAIADHAQDHFSQYMNHVVHDHFGDDLHQLAAVAFNAMMESHFAGIVALAQPRTEGEEPERALDSEDIDVLARRIWCRFVGIPITEPYTAEYQWLHDAISGNEKRPSVSLTEAVKMARGENGPPKIPIRFAVDAPTPPAPEQDVYTLAEIEKAIQDEMDSYADYDAIHLYDLRRSIRRRLAHPEPEPARVTWIQLDDGRGLVRRDGQDVATFVNQNDAERYAAGLRAEIEAGGK